MDRSIALLKSLGIERERWEATSETFKSQMATIIGDVLLSSAYLAYAGYFDQHVCHFCYLFNIFKVCVMYMHAYVHAHTFSPNIVNLVFNNASTKIHPVLL